MRTLCHSQRSGRPQGRGLSPMKFFFFQYFSFLSKNNQFRLFCSKLPTLWRSHLSCAQTPTCELLKNNTCSVAILSLPFVVFLLFDCFFCFHKLAGSAYLFHSCPLALISSISSSFASSPSSRLAIDRPGTLCPP